MVQIDCFRSEEIADPESDYHLEAHLCFICGAPFEPTPDLPVCPVCNWYLCPDCGGCRCSLSPEDRRWLEFIREVFCQVPEVLAKTPLGLLPMTTNPNLRAGMMTQLYFCQKGARQLCRRS